MRCTPRPTCPRRSCRRRAAVSRRACRRRSGWSPTRRSRECRAATSTGRARPGRTARHTIRTHVRAWPRSRGSWSTALAGDDRRAGDTRSVLREVRRGGFREIKDVLRATTPTHLHLRSRLTFVLVATVLFDLVATVLILLFERNAHGTAITNIGDSLFWTTSQLLTVS